MQPGRVSNTIISLALVAAIAIGVPALGDSGPSRQQLASSPAAKAVKKAKKALKLAKQNRKAIANIELTPGPQGTPGQQGEQGEQGQQGQQGPAGEPATRLFAFVQSDGTLSFGAGATSATRNAQGNYHVEFDRDVRNCVAVAEAGLSIPSGGTFSNNPTTRTEVGFGLDGGRVIVSVNDADSASSVDSSFMVVVSC